MRGSLELKGYQPDGNAWPAQAFRLEMWQQQSEIPFHHHRKGQLILALHGGITCEVENAMWIVPPHYAVWIPGNVMHSNRASAQARLCFLFIEPGAVTMPERCCTLKISPLVKELILTLAERGADTPPTPETNRLVAVLCDELLHQPTQPFQIPISQHPVIEEIARYMSEQPAARRTLAQWANRLAMSERSLARLIYKETGLSYRRWRQRLQLMQALPLLVSGTQVQQVARALGYESTTAFITIFRQITGQTPGHYLRALETDAFH